MANSVSGLDIRLLNRATAPLSIIPLNLVDGTGVSYQFYSLMSAECGPAIFPERVLPGSTARGIAAWTLVPAGAKGLQARVEVSEASARRGEYESLETLVLVGDAPP
jgi:hypothetical protein